MQITAATTSAATSVFPANFMVRCYGVANPRTNHQSRKGCQALLGVFFYFDWSGPGKVEISGEKCLAPLSTSDPAFSLLVYSGHSEAGDDCDHHGRRQDTRADQGVLSDDDSARDRAAAGARHRGEHHL